MKVNPVISPSAMVVVTTTQQAEACPLSEILENERNSANKRLCTALQADQPKQTATEALSGMSLMFQSNPTKNYFNEMDALYKTSTGQ